MYKGTKNVPLSQNEVYRDPMVAECYLLWHIIVLNYPRVDGLICPRVVIDGLIFPRVVIDGLVWLCMALCGLV